MGVSVKSDLGHISVQKKNVHKNSVKLIFDLCQELGSTRLSLVSICRMILRRLW